jgi:hypothetical protein
MTERRIVLEDCNGQRICAPEHGLCQAAAIDITGVHHANAALPVRAVVEQRCDLGRWHTLSSTELPAWGPAL